MATLRTPPLSRGVTPADVLDELSLQDLGHLLDKFKVKYRQNDTRAKLMQRLDKADLDEKEVQTFALRMLKSEENGNDLSDSSVDEGRTDSGGQNSADRSHGNKKGKESKTNNNYRGTRSRGNRGRSGSSEPDPLKDKGENPDWGALDNDELTRRFNKLKQQPPSRKTTSKDKAKRGKNARHDEESLPLDTAEIEIMNAIDTGRHLPNLFSADEEFQGLVARLGPVYKAKVERGVEHLWWFADAIFGTETRDNAFRGAIVFAQEDLWDQWWSTNKNKEDQARKWKEFRAYVRSIREKHTDVEMRNQAHASRSNTASSLSSPTPTDDENDPYDCKAARTLRKKFHGSGDPKADEMEVEDPDNPGETVKADIIGRHPTRRNWLALALPSNNSDRMFMSRGHYVDGTKDVYKEAFNRYVQKGSNIILSTATDKKHLDDADPEDFELNLVLFMPWGRYYHTHAYGIPHYNKDRDFMLYSKSLLSSAWGTSAADDVLRDHCEQAKQAMPKSTRTKKIRMKAWKHD